MMEQGAGFKAEKQIVSKAPTQVGLLQIQDLQNDNALQRAQLWGISLFL